MRIDDLQATAMLTDRGQRVVSKGKPVRLGLAEAAAPVLDSTHLDSIVLDGATLSSRTAFRPRRYGC